MPLPVLTEQNILDIVYALYEGDVTNWIPESEEYLTARIYANAAINRWEFYEQTNWRELWTPLTDASDGDKTLTAGTYAYRCPTNMIKPASYVRTVGNGSVSKYWDVVSLSKVPSLKLEDYNYCYFTGNIKNGFTLHFNPNVVLNTGDILNYEYYKSATKFTTPTSTTEMSDPYFIVYFVISRLFENDGEDGRASKAFQEAEGRLENMKVANIIHLEGVKDNIEDTIDNLTGFGI